MKRIFTLLAILGAALLSAAEKEKSNALTKIQVVGQVRAPKNMEVGPNMTAAEFFKEAGANEFSTRRRLVVLRCNYIYEQGAETTVRNLEFRAEYRIGDLHLMDGDVVCIVTKPPVGE